MARRFRPVLLLMAVLLIAAPGLAMARAGGGGSMGSRGGYSYSAPPSTPTAPGGGSMLNRSLTPQSPGYGGSGYGYRRPGMFGGGFGAGLLGAGLIGMMLGHGFFGGIFGFGSMLGLILQIVLVVWLVRWLLRMFAGGPSLAGIGGMARGMMGGAPGAGMGGGVGGGVAGGGGPASAIAIGPADYQAFEQALQQIQAAWSGHDIARLQTLATPEMVSYFAEQLAAQASRGVRNQVSDVRLEQGDLAQAWAEPGREYATVAMRFSMIDVTTDAGGRVVDGSPTEHVAATELWTFVRAPGGRWILSAIQQAR